ncbi:MAG: adenylate/guanylate cyclase domain-containing protein [Sulfitobacter sp.]|nr:adenylate/guanylate cyclase domain-containing protein [Sulfitobacter sp.]
MLIDSGLKGATQEALVESYCEAIIAAGVPLMRLHLAQRAYHPEFGGFGFDYYRDKGLDRSDFARTASPVDTWLKSPLYFLLSITKSELRGDLTNPEDRARFPIFEELFEMGGTDYLAAKAAFTDTPLDANIDPNDPPEGYLISWTSDREGGFTSEHLALLRGLMPALGIALKCASHKQMAVDIVSTYLGADAGQRVLSGAIQRGSSETIHAVIWYFDLQGFTRLSEEVAGTEVIALLNAYFGEVVAVVEDHGGNVLKFMGDGLLAIFDATRPGPAVDQALAAALTLDGRLKALSQARGAQGLPVTGYSLALHLGDVLYGNIGGAARLDFTVIGSAVNTTARILSFCNQLEQRLILSDRVAKASETRQEELVSLGRYMLRGVARPMTLYTLYPDKSQT